MSDKTLAELYKDLKNYSNFDEEGNAGKFLDAADQIVLKQDPSSIKELLQYFDDDTEYSWVCEEVRCLIEAFPDALYVKKIVENLKEFFVRAPSWCLDIMFSLVNNKACLQLFRENLHLADRQSLLKLFDLMEKESPHHRDLIKELRKEFDKVSK